MQSAFIRQNGSRARCRALGGLAGCGRLSPPLRAEIAAAAAPLTPAVDDDAAVAMAGTSAVAAGATALPDAWPVGPDAGLERYVRRGAGTRTRRSTPRCARSRGSATGFRR